MRILLVEDDALLADGLARALGQSGYLVDVASDGKTADTWLENETYDLAILDLGLPGLDGADVLQRLRARRQLVPVLILSAREALEEAELEEFFLAPRSGGDEDGDDLLLRYGGADNGDRSG